jgi:hypothetical protein
VKKLGLVIGASLREQLRWATQHLYTLLILTPLVLGISYLTVSRLAEEAPSWHPSFRFSFFISSAFVFTAVVLSLSRAAIEIYHLQRPESVLDALPVSNSTHFHAALAKRIVRTAGLGLLILVIRLLFAQSRFDPATTAALLLFVLMAAQTQIFAALNWIHVGHTRSKPVAIGTSASIVASSAVGGSLLLIVFSPGMLPAASSSSAPLSAMIVAAVWSMALYAIAKAQHQRWRTSDIEYAKRIQSANRESILALFRLEKWFQRTVAEQLRRDLQLTLRAFSSAVYVAVFIAALLLLAMMTVLVTDLLPADAGQASWFSGTWLPAVMAAKIGCVLVTTSLSIVVAVLVQYQIPHFWLERAVGVTGNQMWQTKLWYARLISLPAPVLATTLAVVSGMVPLWYALPLLAECVWMWWITSTLIGGLAFEVPDRPELAIVLMLSAGTTFGLFVSVFWPIGFVLYALNLLRGLTERGQSRASYCLLMEEA